MYNNNQLDCGFTACVAWALLGNHSSTITIACGGSKRTFYGCNRYSCLWSNNTVCV